MKQRVFLRPTLSIVMLFIGVFIANLAIPSEFELSTRLIIFVIAGLAFGLLGFILPEVAAFIARAGIEEVARQIARMIPANAGELANFTRPLRFGNRRKKKETKPQNPLIIDTSALIDGRIGDIVKSGFLGGTWIILPSVLSELHQISDSRDDIKRARGRRGLDILEAIRENRGVKMETVTWEPGNPKVDDKLIAAAKKLKGSVVTVDFNLAKVARVQKVRVLNINELANAVKTVILPSEELVVPISAAGKGKDQGVGFLDDGTMVVVENGAGFVGRDIKVKVNKVLQTSAGKMIFAKSIV